MGRKSRKRLVEEEDKDLNKDKNENENEKDIIVQRDDHNLNPLYDILYDILQDFRQIDSRLEFVNISDILKPDIQYGPGRIIDDRFIRELSHLLYHNINQVRGVKKIHGFSDLKPTIIYNRIAHRINFCYIDMIEY